MVASRSPQITWHQQKRSRQRAACKNARFKACVPFLTAEAGPSRARLSAAATKAAFILVAVTRTSRSPAGYMELQDARRSKFMFFCNPHWLYHRRGTSRPGTVCACSETLSPAAKTLYTVATALPSQKERQPTKRSAKHHGEGKAS